MKTFRHSGKAGDIIFSLPCIRELGGGILYIPENTPDSSIPQYTELKRLLEYQPYITEVREYQSGLNYGEKSPGIHIDYDLDDARKQPFKGRIHIVKRYLDTYGIVLKNWKEPWLIAEKERAFYGNLVNWTPRYQTQECNMSLHERLPPLTPSYFVGLYSEYAQFTSKYGYLPYIQTPDIYDLAALINSCKALYCTQSLCLALAQALGKEYYLERYKNKTNCHLYTTNEHLL